MMTSQLAGPAGTDLVQVTPGKSGILRGRLVAVLAVLTLILVLSGPLYGQAPTPSSLEVSFGGDNASFSAPVQILVILSLLTFLPAMVISMTSFTRIIIVSHFLRQALGTQQSPSNQILVGLTLFLTFFVMGPVIDTVYDEAYLPYQKGDLTQTEALEKAALPLRTFMLKQVRESDLSLFVRMAKMPKPKSQEELSLRVIIPAFMISELKTAFQIGFVLFLPFLIVDMVISSVLLSMGMMQLPPIVISTPFKILLFILVDGWHLVIGSLVESF